MNPFSSASPIFSVEEELPFLSFFSNFLFDSFSTISSSLSSSLMNNSSPSIFRRSAFSDYTKSTLDIVNSEQNDNYNGGGNNIHRRMIEILRWVERAKLKHNREGSDRGLQYMMRERLRRERLSKSYADLHSMLPLGTKSCKNSIVKSTTMMVRELKIVKQKMQQKNQELLSMLKSTPATEGSSEPSDEVEIKVRMSNTISTVDSMINALQCLKGMDVKIRAIRSELSSEGELTLIPTIQIQMCEGL